MLKIAHEDEVKKLRGIMRNAQGDDLERATLAFRGFSPAAMQQQYGQSGHTRQEILDGYQRDRDLWTRANKLLELMIRELK